MVTMIIILAAIATYNLNAAYNKIIDNAEAGFDTNIKTAVEMLISTLHANHQLYLDGVISQETEMAIAKQIVRDTRYSSAPDKVDDGYFWADMADGYCVVHYNPANEGEMRWDWEDKEDTYYIRLFIELGDAGGGYSEFYFGKPGDETGSHKKRGYTQKFEPYGWYISTGNYFEDTDMIIKEVESQKTFSLITLLGISILIAIVGLLLLSRNLNSIIYPIRNISDRIRQLSAGDSSAAGFKPSGRNDEIGELEDSISKLSEAINAQAGILQAISEGDYSVSIAVRSNKDVMNEAITDMLQRTNEVMSKIKASTGQVSASSTQMSNGARTLAQGSSEQTTAVGRLSSSISQISKSIKDNAELARRAAALAGTIKQNAEESNRHMDEMIIAVNDITQASQSISRVIKIIDDIAFQTNILALNAAVEAARAGVHGKGFAVVAEEVRNLATRSAEAAKDTEDLIADSIEKAELGANIAKNTAGSLEKIVSGIKESDQIAGEIVKSSEVQSKDITDINLEISQVESVIHRNSVTSEESASVSEKMSSQAGILEALLSQFKLRNNA